MIRKTSLRHLAVLALSAAGLVAGSAAIAQDSSKEESAEAFLSRMQSEMRRMESWVQNLDTAVQKKMGMASASGNRIGVNNSGVSSSRLGNDPMSSDLRRMRLDLRSLKKEIAEEKDRMERQYGTRDAEGFDRNHWEVVVRRMDAELREMQRDLRRL